MKQTLSSCRFLWKLLGALHLTSAVIATFTKASTGFFFSQATEQVMITRYCWPTPRWDGTFAYHLNNIIPTPASPTTISSDRCGVSLVRMMKARASTSVSL